MIEALVATAVALVAPYLGKAGEEAAKTVGKDGAAAGIKLLGWLRDKATGRAKEALADAEAAPSDDNQADLRKQLARLLQEHPELVKELQDLVPASGADSGDMTQTVSTGGKGVQIKGGTGHSVSIG